MGTTILEQFEHGFIDFGHINWAPTLKVFMHKFEYKM